MCLCSILVRSLFSLLPFMFQVFAWQVMNNSCSKKTLIFINGPNKMIHWCWLCGAQVRRQYNCIWTPPTGTLSLHGLGARCFTLHRSSRRSHLPCHCSHASPASNSNPPDNLGSLSCRYLTVTPNSTSMENHFLTFHFGFFFSFLSFFFLFFSLPWYTANSRDFGEKLEVVVREQGEKLFKGRFLIKFVQCSIVFLKIYLHILCRTTWNM